MIRDGEMDYAAARIHAHQGRLVDESHWRRLEASRDLGQFLGAARDSPFAEWTAAMNGASDCHAIERALRDEWRHRVREVSAWHPAEWQAWLGWCQWLPTLSLLAELARPEPAPAWLLADPVCGAVAPGSPAERARALAGTALAPLAPAVADRVPPGALWREHWRSLMPRVDSRTRDLLERMMREIDVHAGALLTGATATPQLRSKLAARFAQLFRMGAGTVVATACHLGMLALALERLRGGLIRRCALPAQAGGAAA